MYSKIFVQVYIIPTLYRKYCKKVHIVSRINAKINDDH